jgi:hypothetical protein
VRPVVDKLIRAMISDDLEIEVHIDIDMGIERSSWFT